MDDIISNLEASSSDPLETSLDRLLDHARRHASQGEFDDDVCLLAMDVR